MTRRRSRVRFLSASLAAVLSVACGDADDAVAPGTRRMADTLAAIHARTQADARDPFANAARVAAIRRELARSPRFDPAGMYLLAQEQLAAGMTRDAIASFESIIGGLGLTQDRIDPQSKILFDMLAMSWLRLGEQQNCLSNPAANVCILPLAGAARHADQEGARRAIGLYQALLRHFPDDLGSRWLLNLSYLATGGYPDSIPPRFLVRGIQPRPDVRFPIFHNIAPVVGLAVDGLSGGLATEDFDGDGHLDVFLTSWGLGDQVKLFLADGTGGYRDFTDSSGLAGITGGLNVNHADYDNDGDADLFVMRGAWLGDLGAHPNSLLRNDGGGRFSDVTFEAGLFSRHPTPTAQWQDYDRDGDLDLFVGNESGAEMNGGSHPSELFRNNGDGTFSEVAAASGLRLDAFVKSVAWGDVDRDGNADLFASVLFGKNRLFLNRGPGSDGAWRFEEAAERAGVTLPLASFGSWFWDVDQDGDDDLVALSYDVRNSGSLHDAVAREYVDPRRATGAPPGVEATRLYRNRGDGTFDDVTRAMGLEGRVIFAMGHNYGDLDNDGWLDFYVGTGNPDLRSVIPNRMFRNVGGRRFEEVTIEGGFGHIQKGHGTAFVDLDRDGDQDVYMGMGGAYEGDRAANVLFENPGAPGTSWLALTLEGTQANRSAIGARVRVDVVDATGKPRALYRTVGTGASFGSGPLALHFGLADAVRIERITITWPDRGMSTTEHRGLERGHAYRIVQGSEPMRLDRPPVPFAKQGIAAHQHH